MTVNFKEFMEIARQAKALDVLETWDENTFNAYTEEFGSMTKEAAIDLCYFLEAVSQEEQAAGEYFSRRQGLTKPHLSGILIIEKQRSVLNVYYSGYFYW